MLFTLASLLLATVVAGDCNADNCLRALRSRHATGSLDSLKGVCANSASGDISTATIPQAVASACKDNQNGSLSFRISSACACIEKAAATSSITPSGTVIALTTTQPSNSTLSKVTPTATLPPATTEACALVSSSWLAQSSLWLVQSSSWSSQAAKWTATVPLPPIGW
jgi:hypothetical protein